MKAWSRWQEWLNLLLGAWVFLSPWFLGFSQDQGGSWDAWVLGILLALVALWALAAPFSLGPVWSAAVLGALLFLSPWALGFANLTAQAWNAWVAGVAVLILSVWDVLQPRNIRSRYA